MNRSKPSPKNPYEIWLELLGKEGLSVASDETVEEIIKELLIPDKISPIFFINNYRLLLSGGMPSYQDLFRKDKPQEPTSSLKHFVSPINRAPAFPLWFVATYPDVLAWFHDWQEDCLRRHNYDTTAVGDEKINDKDFIDNNGQFIPNYLKKIVIAFKNQTGKGLETQVDLQSDIYLGYEMIEKLGIVEDSFVIIARNTTKYYLELCRNYKDRFKDDISIVATAGVLDAQVYVFAEKTISLSEIQEIAKEAFTHGKDFLIEFIIKLEIKIFKVDNSNLSSSDIEESCISQKIRMREEIDRVMLHYDSEPLFASSVAPFMNFPEFKASRRQLGIVE
jgi:hypothetical protein